MGENLNQENENFRISREMEQKYEFYFIALVFTILGLSIQTAIFTNYIHQYIVEIAGWACLALSGLAGLSRLEWEPVVYRQYGSIDKEKRGLSIFNQGLKGRIIMKEDQEEWSIEELKNAKGNLEIHIAKREEIIKKLENSTIVKYKIHKWCFVIGVICIIYSRAFVGLSKFLIHSQ